MPARPKWKTVVGWVLSALPSLMMLFSGAMKLSHNPAVVEGFAGKFGYQGESTLTIIGLLEVACVAVYLIPRTTVLGAILMTGYLGGAVATHVRLLDPSFVAPFLLGVFAWGGLYLRDSRVSALIPVTPPAND
jgi:hypothetical protein